MDTPLDAIPWADLQHAYGSAADTPNHLRALREPSDEAFADAMEGLWASICHQGSVYEASGYAVPFLVAILQEASEPRREQLILFLAELADHDVYALRDREIFTNDDFRHVWEFPTRTSPNIRYKYQDFINEGNEHYQARWTQATHERVGEEIPQLLALWPQFGPGARGALLYLCSAFAEHHKVFMPLLDQILNNDAAPTTEIVAALLCLGDIAKAPDEALRALAHRFIVHQEPAVRLSAALSLLRSQSYPLSDAAQKLLVEVLVQPDGYDLYEPALSTIPWFFGGEPHTRLLADLGHSRPDEAIPILLLALARGATFWYIPDTIRVAEVLLDLTFFGIMDSGRDWMLEVLSPAEADALEIELADNPLEQFVLRMRHDDSISLLHNFGSSFGYRQGVNAWYNEAEAARFQQERTAHSVTTQQREILLFLLDYEPIWQWPTNLFAIYGLPTVREELRMFCNIGAT